MNAPAAALIPLLVLAGCAAPHQTAAPDSHTELIRLTPLPPLTSHAMAFGVKLSVVFNVLPDGSTKGVSLLQSSGDPDWDSMAVDSLSQWRFTPLTGEKEQSERWIRYGVVVQVQEPIVMRLAEMIVPNRRKADSLSALLKGGADYDSLAVQALTGGAGGSWRPPESVNIARYPSRVRETLNTLRPDEITEPVRIGLDYVIFKRYGPAK